jgi:hypothetical protein
LQRLVAHDTRNMRDFVPIFNGQPRGELVPARRLPAYAQHTNWHTIIVLWLTAGTWRRARTIHTAWMATIRQSALFSTMHQLRRERETGLMDPLGEIWLDVRGRGMRGWNLFEATCR